MVLVTGTLFAFTVSSTLGLGGGVLMLPPMLYIFDTPTAIALIAPLMLINAVGKLWVFRHDLQLRTALLLGALGWPAALGGGLLVDQVDARLLKILIVGLIVGMLALERGLGRQLNLSSRALPGWGLTTGLLSGMTGVSGPPLALVLKAHGVAGASFVAVVALVVVGLQILRIPAYVARGVLTTDELPLMALLALLASGAVALGRILQQRMSVERWRVALDLLLGAVGLFLTADVLGWVPR